MKKSGFTLVELVITITILVILSTIAFVSFQSYTQDSRDANRLSSLNEIQKGLTLSYSKNGSFPTPKNATTYTGGTISLLQGTLTQEILPELQSDPKDPLSKSSYTYSTTSDGEYFQIASDIENIDVLSQLSPQKTYAKVSSALVKGNYKFDPSLPSLVLISTTSLTNSGIFSPDNCFVTNGGSNTIGNTTCTTKKQSSLKNTDSSLVGYWDMETLTGTQLLDLSGNGNNGVAKGGIIFSSSTGLVSRATDFNGSAHYIEITDSDSLDMGKNDLTLSFVTKYGTGLANIGRFLNKGAAWNYNSAGYEVYFGDSPSQIIGTINSGTGSETSRSWARLMDNNLFGSNTFYYIAIVFKRSDSSVKVYINGKKQKFSEGTKMGNFQSIDISNSSNLVIGSRVWESKYFKGSIDELKIHMRALGDDEIEQQAKILGF